MKLVDTFVMLATTSTSINKPITKFEVIVLPLSSGGAFPQSKGNKTLNEVGVKNYKEEKHLFEKGQTRVDSFDSNIRHLTRKWN